MKNIDKIIQLAEEHNGYISAHLLTKNNIARVYLSQMVETNQLVKVTRGLYMLPDYFEDEFYKYQFTNKTAYFSLETALYLHGLNNRIPTTYQLFVPNHYNGNLQKNKNIELVYVNPTILDLGSIEMDSPYGNKIKTYDIDKTICDMIKYKSRVDSEIFSNALKEYVKLKNKNINHLIFYAKKMNIEEEVRKYMEVLL